MNSGFGHVLGDGIHPGDEAHELAGGQLSVEEWLVGDVGELGLGRTALFGQPMAADGDLSAVGAEETGEHFDCCSFPGAVGTEECEDLSGGDAQRDAVDGSQASEAFGYVFEYE